jgi:K+-sensing histidine kinase KdpD
MPYPVTTPAIYVEQVEEIVKEARAKLDEMRERLIGQGVEVSHVFVNDMADRGIVAVAKETNADLIVVGSHGRTGISRFLIGSIAERVVRHAHCDVLVARGDAPSGGFKNVLLPVDFSEVSDRAMARAAAVPPSLAARPSRKSVKQRRSSRSRFKRATRATTSRSSPRPASTTWC